MSPVFTGDDLRRWLDEERGADVASLDLLIASTPGMSWESVAKWMREAFEDLSALADFNPAVLAGVVGAYFAGANQAMIGVHSRVNQVVI